MAVGKNKRISKGGKKGSKKKIVDPFTRKDWYRIRAPAIFAKRDIGFTCVNRTSGTKIASDFLKGRVVEVSLADLQNDPDAERSYRKFKLVAEGVLGTDVLTNFHGMTFATDKLSYMVRKWQDVIEGTVDVKTKDGYLLRLFCIGFTKREVHSVKKRCYAKRTLAKAVRLKMVENMRNAVTGSTLRQVINKLIPDTIASDIEKDCRRIFPLTDVYVHKVKVLKKPKFTMTSLLEMHETSKEDVGQSPSPTKNTEDADFGVVVDRPDGYEPPVVDDL